VPILQLKYTFHFKNFESSKFVKFQVVDMSLLVRIFLTLSALFLLVDAGCKKKPAINVALDELSFNAVKPIITDQAAQRLSQKNFTWMDEKLLTPSWNQHIPQYCGSCWLHGTLSMIQDRLKIVKNGLSPDVILARQVVLNCGAFHTYGDGCNGGDVIDVLRYMKNYGLPDETCMPYSATDHTQYGDKDLKKCPADGYCRNCMPLKDVDTCWSVKTPMRYYLDSYGKVPRPGEESMMAELAARGPITCSIATPETFDYGYYGGMATDPTNSTDVDHDIEVVGWGESGDGETKWWVVRNSWGSYWGEMGFFKLERGRNALQIEAGDCWWAMPTWEDEQKVRSGELVGTMWGVMTPEEAAQIKPEGHRHPHKVDDDDDVVGVNEEEEERRFSSLRAEHLLTVS